MHSTRSFQTAIETSLRQLSRSDIKPENLLSLRGAGKLADLGLATHLHEPQGNGRVRDVSMIAISSRCTAVFVIIVYDVD